MSRKTLLSWLLALAMLLSLAAPALAAEAPWYAAAQAYVTENGLMASGGGFDPEGAAAGQDLLGALYSLEGRPAARTGEGFDVWRQTLPAVSETVTRGQVLDFLDAYAPSRGFDAAGLMIGDESGDLMLDRPLKRAELAQILLRLRDKPVPVFTEVSDLQILATSDLHGKFYPWTYGTDSEDLSGSMTQLSTAVSALRTENSLLVDAGDTVQDNYASLFLGEDVHPMIAAMNAIGYDVWVTGNHEYNYGMDNLKKVIGTMEAKVLVGNVLDTDGRPLADGYTIIEKDGLRVGVIGMVTPNITRWDEMNLAGCTVTDPVEETRRIIDEIKGETDLLIGVMHMGVNEEYGTPDSGVADLAEACPELALIVAAHDHKRIEGDQINGVLVVEDKNQAQTMSEVHLYLGKTAEGWTLLRRTALSHSIADYAPDAALTEQLAPYHEEALADAHTVIGKLEGGNLAPENEIAAIPAAQIMDTALLDLINEVQMYYADADVSTAALFIPEANLKAGDIRRCDTSEVYKFDNTLYKLRMTGAQLKTYMEWSAGYYNQFREGDLTISFNPDFRANYYDVFAGVNYTIDISKPVGERILELTWPDGTPVADDDTFVLAANNYRSNTQLLSDVVFGDGDKPELLEIDVCSSIGGVRDLIGDYIAAVKGGTITPECDNNWRLVGYSWDEALHQKAVELLADGTLTIPSSPDGRTPNVKPIRAEDLEASGGAADADIIDAVYENFLLLAAIPRPSHHEKQVSDFLAGWVTERGARNVTQDEVYNLIFDLPATPGYENLPKAAVQAHMDMVCVGEEGSDYDMLTDPIRVIRDDASGTLTAEGTSLGADDGVGLAIIMAIVEGKMDHGPLRVIFTVDEEDGMTGAFHLDPGAVADVDYLINVDDEVSDEVLLSTAAGEYVSIDDGVTCLAPRGSAALTLELRGLKGGHSGVEIDKGRLNGIIAMARLLEALKAEGILYELASLSGGSAPNAIPPARRRPAWWLPTARRPSRRSPQPSRRHWRRSLPALRTASSSPSPTRRCPPGSSPKPTGTPRCATCWASSTASTPCRRMWKAWWRARPTWGCSKSTPRAFRPPPTPAAPTRSVIWKSNSR